MNKLISVIKAQKIKLKNKKNEQSKYEDKLEEQRIIKNNIIQKQREIKTISQILKTPLAPQSLLEPSKTIVLFFAKMLIIGIPTLFFVYGPLINLLHTTKIVSTIISIIIFSSLTFITQIIASKRYKQKIRNKLIKVFQTDNIETINKKLDNELEETIKHQKKLNQAKYRLNKDIDSLQKEIEDNYNKLYNQIVSTSTKETIKDNNQVQTRRKIKILKRTEGVKR